tara:strand:- start:2000 stop:2443 length:444 start_codon:yes stop_codon:yes gene_type:complete
MPKPKPDQVIRHEIVLGRSERELISDGLLAYQVNRISTPLVALISDVSAMSLILGALATYYGFKFEIPQQGYDSALELYNDFRIQYDAFKETVTEITPDPIGQILSILIPTYRPFTGANRPDPFIPQVENPDIYVPTGSNPVFGSPI